MRQIRIELQSNLCASSGDGYASTIDTDVVTDTLGIPFIPARRLKGCLREAAVYIYGEKSSIVEGIFGIPGDVSSGSLRLESANIEEYELLRKMCAEQELPPARVTELFTDTAASTAVEGSGAARENTLRFLRYVSKSKAWDTRHGLVFCAEAEIGDEYAEPFGRICKALRHIGYNRNRGYGCVKCSLVPKDVGKQNFDLPSDIEDDKDYVITYAVKLDEFLMLPSRNSNESADYISGQAVVGALAGRYLKNHDADEMFDRIFLGGVRFSNLYITNDKFEIYVPVPQIYGKTKQSSRIIDMTVTERGDEIVKPLKSGFINASLDVKKPLTERIYHNSINDPDGGLYVQNGIERDQLFMGTISGEGRCIKIIAELLTSGKLSFGRSKTAQYSRCSLIDIKCAAKTDKKVRIKKGDKLVYLFESDAVITDNYAGSDISCAMLCETLGIEEKNIEHESCLKYKMISGFLSVMRLQRAHIRAVAAGSALVVTADKDMEQDEVMYIGGRQNEGFGKVRVFKAGELLKGEKPLLSAETSSKTDSNDDIRAMFTMLEKDEKMRSSAITYALSKKNAFLSDWGAAFIGRVTLMLEQSDSENDFRKRLASIKSKKKRETAEKFLADTLNKWESDPEYKVWDKKQEYLLIILTIAKYHHKERKGAEIK